MPTAHSRERDRDRDEMGICVEPPEYPRTVPGTRA
jgi:hypothetical protein